ncbi:hypothetical protein DL95DRAFT_31666 [Leptodontidium sp. 2 PMI_412]|nr:hypothetical protein DL95DRAFT_31666 [Leptodontidium sp. 2 PMI_412]
MLRTRQESIDLLNSGPAYPSIVIGSMHPALPLRYYDPSHADDSLVSQSIPWPPLLREISSPTRPARTNQPTMNFLFLLSLLFPIAAVTAAAIDVRTTIL